MKIRLLVPHRVASELHEHTPTAVYVVVNFLFQLNFIFLLCLGMVMLLMNLKQRKNKN